MVGESKVLIYRQKIIKKRGGSGQEAVANGEIMIQDQRARAAVTWVMVGRVKSDFIDTWLVDKIKGDNYVVISFWLVTSLVVPYVMAPTNLAFNELLKMTEVVCCVRGVGYHETGAMHMV